MSEMTPDPVFDTLARFTPDSTGVDPAAILFAAGKASARTPVMWKLAVSVLLVTNLAALGLFLLRPSAPAPVVAPIVVPVVVPIPAQQPDSAAPESPVIPSPWSLGALNRVTDLDQFPKSDDSTDIRSASAPLTPRSALRGTID